MSVTDDMRRRVVDAYRRNVAVDVIANASGIPRTTVYGIIRVYRLENRVSSKKRGRPRIESLSLEDKEKIKEWVDDDCSIILGALKTRLREERRVSVSESTISRSLRQETMRRTLRFAHGMHEIF